VPESERLPNIVEVLKHPFFSPNSVEAERFLERFEEVQLLRDSTVNVRKVTKAVKHMMENSMEKYCKLAFATEQIAFPTCLVVLPYTLNIDEATNMPVASANPRLISCAVQLGKCLLEINKATARLSFWLMMSGKMRGPDANEFKAQLQEWLKRARFESCYSIAMEIVNGLGCGVNYVRICEEVLAYDGHISQAKSYMRDPIRAARRAIKQNAEEVSKLFLTASYIYLVDETKLVPHCVPINRTRSAQYPIQLETNPKLIANVFLPFMNIVTMKALARDGFEGLASLLGLPPSMGIPEAWRMSEPGLLHNLDNCASIEDFVILQKILRKNDANPFADNMSVSSRSYMNQSFHSGLGSAQDNSVLSISRLGLANMDLSPGDPAISAIPIAQLELLFRERDPDREFGGMRRVTHGSSVSSRKRLGLWTNVETIKQFKGLVGLAEIEEQLRDLRQDLEKGKQSSDQYARLLNERAILKKNMPNSIIFPHEQRPSLLDTSFDDLPPDSYYDSSYGDRDKHAGSFRGEHSVQSGQPSYDHQLEYGQQSQEQRDGPPRQRSPSLEISTHRMPDKPPTPPPAPELVDPNPDKTPSVSSGPNHPKMDPDESGAKKKMRKSKRRFRPWFTAC
jgi:hypothetical protein